jgi:dienelactone hydrolase
MVVGLATMSCGSDPEASKPGLAGSGATTGAVTGVAGRAGAAPTGTAAGSVAQATAGKTGTTILPTTTAGSSAVAGSGGTTAAGTAAGSSSGSGGTAGQSYAAGTGGSTAGAGGSAGVGGAAGSPTDPGDGFIREDAPTEASAKAKGKFTVEMYTSGFSGNRQDFGGATIYYPTDADPPFASVAVVPGFTAYQSSIAGWGPFLASHGIVTMTIDTLTTSDPPAQRSDELMGALKSLVGENTREGSPLKGKLDTTRQGVSGWSMGGGGTLIAASKNPSLKAAVSFAAWGPSGGANNKVPALMFEGTTDPLAAGMSEPYYGQVPDSTPKMLFEVNGAGHEVANNPRNSMGMIGLYGLSWWKVYLENDQRYKQFLLAPKPSITAKFETNVK